MRTVVYTHRVEIVESYGERRDCADQRIPKFLMACGYLPVPVPNVPELTENFLKLVSPVGVLLTGGNSLEKYGGDAPERDETERRIVEWCLSCNVPIFGICRGMQFLADFFGGVLEPIEGHAGTRHAIAGFISRDSTNSYHTLAVRDVPEELKVLARAVDGSVEAFRHRRHGVLAVGWHPERESIFKEEDMDMIKGLFGKGELT